MFSPDNVYIQNLCPFYKPNFHIVKYKNIRMKKKSAFQF